MHMKWEKHDIYIFDLTSLNAVRLTADNLMQLRIGLEEKDLKKFHKVQ